jgi:hypothetical protein
MGADAASFAVLHVYLDAWGFRWRGLIYVEPYDAIIGAMLRTDLAPNAV